MRKGPSVSREQAEMGRHSSGGGLRHHCQRAGLRVPAGVREGLGEQATPEWGLGRRAGLPGREGTGGIPGRGPDTRLGMQGTAGLSYRPGLLRKGKSNQSECGARTARCHQHRKRAPPSRDSEPRPAREPELGIPCLRPARRARGRRTAASARGERPGDASLRSA
ncbi:unnamed protein product [Rangifer tarandus platyrhynchus]|uniref:Uncharacterized protein n=1 Tax=Rangifer tarandus platyrhynchus TaxID=3082113 RepID=A0ABN8ZYS8_RANTA|nr:unnamed protein product [Rangifer tarandus platyrhynchus]